MAHEETLITPIKDSIQIHTNKFIKSVSIWVKTITDCLGQFTSGLVTSPHFRSPPVRSHDGRFWSPLLAFLFLASRLFNAPGETGLGVWRWWSNGSALCFSVAGGARWRTGLSFRGGTGSECQCLSCLPVFVSALIRFSSANLTI